MNTPTPTDREIAEELTSVLRSEAERVTPAPALQQILTRAHEEGPAKSTRRRGRGWLPVIGGVVATAGLIAAAILIFAPGEERTTLPPAESCAVKVHEGCPVDFALYLTGTDLMTLVGTDVQVKSSGNVGLDAVRALLQAKSTDTAVNPWHGWDTTPPDSGPIADVNSVTQNPGGVTVDFDRPLTTDMASLQGPAVGKRIIQQLVLTVQSALRTQSPITISINGKPADEAFGYQLAIPGTNAFKAQFAHWSWVEGIRPESPRQREVMRSPMTISGTSSTFEGNVRWEITTRAGKVVKQGFTTGGGAPSDYLPYSFRVKLEPGDYTVKLWEPNMASGQEAQAGELYVVYTDFTVK